MPTERWPARASAAPARAAGLLLALALGLSGCGHDPARPPAPLAAPQFVQRIGGDRNGSIGGVQGIDVDAQGRVYVFDGEAVQVFDAAGQPLRRFALVDSTGEPWRSGGLRLGADGTFISGGIGVGLVVFSPEGAFLRRIACVACAETHSYSADSGFERDDAGNIAVLDMEHDRVLRLDAAGHDRGTLGSRTSDPGGFLYPRDITMSGEGFLYVADVALDRITRFAPDGTLAGTFSYGPAQYNDGFGLGVRPDGNLLIARALPQVDIRTPTGALVSSFRLGIPVGRAGGMALLRVGRDGRIYCADAYGQLLRFEADGTGLLQLGRLYGAGAGDLKEMSALAVGPGDVYVVTEGGTRVRRFDRGGVPRDAWRLTQDGRFFSDVTVDVRGQAWVALGDAGQVARLDPAGVITPVFEIPVPPGMASPYGYRFWQLTAEAGGGFLLSSGYGGGRDYLARVSAQGALLAWRRMSAPTDRGEEESLGPVAVAGEGRYWILPFYSSRVLLLNDVLEVIAARPLPDPEGNGPLSPEDLAVDPVGGVTLSLPYGRFSLAQLDADGRWLAAWTLDEDSHRHGWPTMLAYDDAGRLYLPDRQAGVIDVYAMPTGVAGVTR